MEFASDYVLVEEDGVEELDISVSSNKKKKMLKIVVTNILEYIVWLLGINKKKKDQSLRILKFEINKLY